MLSHLNLIHWEATNAEHCLRKNVNYQERKYSGWLSSARYIMLDLKWETSEGRSISVLVWADQTASCVHACKYCWVGDQHSPGRRGWTAREQRAGRWDESAFKQLRRDGAPGAAALVMIVTFTFTLTPVRAALLFRLLLTRHHQLPKAAGWRKSQLSIWLKTKIFNYYK